MMEGGAGYFNPNPPGEDGGPDPELLAQILALGTQNRGLSREMEHQQKLADLLRGNMPEGQMVSGRYVAPHFLQYAAQLGKDASAEYKGRQVSKMGTQIDANMGTQNSALLSEILRNAKMDTMARQRRAAASQPIPPLPAYNDASAMNPRGANPYAYTGN